MSSEDVLWLMFGVLTIVVVEKFKGRSELLENGLEIFVGRKF